MQCTPTPEVKVIKDGEKAITFLDDFLSSGNTAAPELIMLDLNLPRVDGREVLAHIKTNPGLKHIPVIIFSSSEAEKDIQKCYDLQANCYIVKPFDFNRFSYVIRAIYDFWFNIVKHP